jgi:hypothetical protein
VRRGPFSGLHFSGICLLDPTILAVLSGLVHISDLPSSGVTTGQIQTLRPPNPSSTRGMRWRLHSQGIGAVTALEWTSDGYALAVGWERGWALYTVGGRCIASSVWYEGEIVEERCVSHHTAYEYHTHD